MTSTTSPTPSPSSLWRLAVPVAWWTAHFLACYVTAAIWCGRWAAATPWPGVTGLVLLHTVIALAGLTWPLAHGRHGRPDFEPAREFDDDTPFDRHQFVATAHGLLTLLGVTAVLFVAAATLVVPQCR